MYLGKAAIPLLVQERNDNGVSFSWPDNPQANFSVPVSITQNGQVTEYAVPSTGEVFPLPEDALLQVDPRVTLFRDFGTTEACEID